MRTAVCAHCGTAIVGVGPDWRDRAGQRHCPEHKLTAWDYIATDDDGQPVTVSPGRHEPAR